MSESLSVNSCVSHYRILQKLGTGGMGEVYLAEDTELERHVALKILLAEVADDEDRVRRFVQEAKAASALNHPNILTVYEIGSFENSRFIVTELIKGETLRERLQGEPLSLREILDVAVQIASALNAAHAAGIVHRDIKPENIMLRDDGLVKVLDFGLAKLTEKQIRAVDSEGETRAQVRTSPGMVMGTVNYMSPEQARGKETDARSDIWSLGVVLFEMLTRKMPFEGETTNDTLAAILTREPALLDGSTPTELRRIIRKALQKKAGERYQTIKDFLLDVKNLKHDLEFAEELERSQIPNLTKASNVRTNPSAENATAILPAVVSTQSSLPLATSSAEYIVGEVRKHKLGAALGALILLVLLGAGVWFLFLRTSSARQIESIAVLPFVNESGNADNEYLSDGMTETLIRSLSQIPNLNVKARSSVFRYKGKEIDLPKIARELNVQAILTGRVLQHGEQLVMNLELVDALTENIIWAEQYSRNQTDLVSLQTEIARDVSNKLRPKLSSAEERRLTKSYTENTEAYKFYLQGRFHFNKFSESDFRKGIGYFNQAIALDPNYALAYTGVADCYFGLSDQYEPPREVMPKARAAAEKALELDDSLAEAHVSLGLVKGFHEWKWAETEEQFQRAIALNPNYGNAHHFYARYLAFMGRFDEAVKESERAVQIEPLSPNFNRNLGYMLLLANRNDEAVRQLQKTFELEPDDAGAHSYLGMAYLKRGEFERAVSESEKAAQADRSARYVGGLGYAYAAADQHEKAQRVLDELNKIKDQRYASSYYFAVVYAGLNEKDQAFAYLEKAYSERADALISIKVNPWLDNLRSDPRFQNLLRRIGLPQ